jgi:segregation and condensation protein B
MSLKAKVEAIIYAAEEPITLEQISVLLKDAVLADLTAARENAIARDGSAAETDHLADDEYASEADGERAFQASAQAGGAPWESTVLPELDSSEEELNGLEPGPLMPQTSALVLAEIENLQECAAFGEDDEPLFATNPAVDAEAATPATGSLADASEAAPCGPAPEESASVAANVTGPDAVARRRQPKKSEQEIADDKSVRTRLREILSELVADYASEDRGMEIRQVAGGFRMATKPQHHDVVRAFAKSLKPPIRLSLAALETLAVIAYKQPVTAPEIADIRGVESASVLGTLLDRKLITTAGRKQVIGRPMQYKTSKDFLLRFGLNDVNELPSMEEFSQLASDATIEIASADALQTPSLFEPETGTNGSETNETGSPLPDAPQPDAEHPDAEPSGAEQSATAQASATQLQSEAEPDNTPEAGNPLGQ